MDAKVKNALLSIYQQETSANAVFAHWVIVNMAINRYSPPLTLQEIKTGVMDESKANKRRQALVEVYKRTENVQDKEEIDKIVKEIFEEIMQ